MMTLSRQLFYDVSVFTSDITFPSTNRVIKRESFTLTNVTNTHELGEAIATGNWIFYKETSTQQL
jgi:hypothetical protein